MKKHWHFLQPDPHTVQKHCNVLKCHPAIAATLVNRNIFSSEDAFNFLFPSLKCLNSPLSIKDIDAAANRILTAIAQREKILIFGDYDVDGITATSILLEFFRATGIEVSFYIPHRINEGYGLQSHHILDYALPKKIDLIITADCGSGSHEAVKTAQAAGIDVIITDHHTISDHIPPAVAVINPKRNDCPSGLDHLSGAGVAFYLLIYLRKKLRDNHFWRKTTEPNLKNLCDLVALGTLGDMVPLVAENRIISKTGIKTIHSTHRVGLDALIEVCGLDKHAVDADDIVFALVPRLNSAGRMDHASTAVDLLTTTSVETAGIIVHSLNHMNQNRRHLENEILKQVENHIAKNPHLLLRKSLIFAHDDWHLGVLGIVANRLMKKYFRPTILIATSGGMGKGSARSIPDVDIFKGLSACADDLENFGGHSMAAGLKLKVEKIEYFQENFENTIGVTTKPSDFIPKVLIDYELAFDDISASLVEEIELLTPFGTGNHEPLFMAKNVKVESSKIVGNNHRRMRLKQDTGKISKAFNAIQFNIDKKSVLRENFDQIAFRLRWNRWGGKKTAQIVIEET